MYLFSFFSICLIFYYSNTFLKSNLQKVFIYVFTFSTMYYGVIGAFYWFDYRDGDFLGVNWSESDLIVVLSFLATYFLAIVVYVNVYRNSRPSLVYDPSYVWVSDSSLRWVIAVLSIVGFFASVYTYIAGSQLKDLEVALLSDPLLLITYQLSDLLIAILLYLFVESKRRVLFYFLYFSYFVFCVVIGLRYRLVLLVGPIIIYYYFASKIKFHNKLIISFLVGGLLLLLFSIMTTARSKFSGIDLNVLSEVDFEKLMYGFFADANIVFGLASAFEVFGDVFKYVGFQPLADLFIQFVPRALKPDKDLYQHLQQVLYGMTWTQEGIASGTSVPYFGEYYMMYGTFAVLIGVLIYAALVKGLVTYIEIRFQERHALVGVALVSLYFGYYYFSRGSIAQIFKGFLFVILPYIFILHLKFRRRIKSKLR